LEGDIIHGQRQQRSGQALSDLEGTRTRGGERGQMRDAGCIRGDAAVFTEQVLVVLKRLMILRTIKQGADFLFFVGEGGADSGSFECDCAAKAGASRRARSARV